jgi:hypothetical protein
MFVVEMPDEVLERKPGRKKLFQGEKLDELIEFLRGPDATYATAAAHFGCSKSAIYKKVVEIRRNARTPHESTGLDAGDV